LNDRLPGCRIRSLAIYTLQPIDKADDLPKLDLADLGLLLNSDVPKSSGLKDLSEAIERLEIRSR
jgi:hypothetical protein